MTHEEKNIGGGAEHPSSEEQKISILLSDLKRVEAPKDFDFHLKARIANAQPAANGRVGLLPILKYAMPLALFLIVGAGVLVSSSYNNWDNPTVADAPNNPDARTSQASLPTVPANPAAGQTPSQDNDSGSGQEVAAQPKTDPSSNNLKRVVPKQQTSNGFYVDIGVNPAPTPIIPPEFRGNSNTSPNSNVVPTEMAAKPLALRDALQSIGIEVELEENKWKVKSVKASSIGEMLGAKAGDKLESIDGRVVDDKTVYKDGSFKVKTIRVRRGEAAVDLQMKKPQK